MKHFETTLGWSLVALMFVAGSADAKARQRPLSDFLDAQGTTSFFIPPVPDYIGWAAPGPDGDYIGGNSGSCDYAGLANQWLVDNGGDDLGTSFQGSVSERDLDDGRVLVQVELTTSNALSFGLLTETFDFSLDPVIFGARAPDVLEGATPGIGSCHLSVSWKQEPGDLPDLITAVFFGEPPIELLSISMRAQASGPLADGSAGRMTISQTGIFHTAFMGATGDGFPAEIVDVRSAGK